MSWAEALYEQREKELGSENMRVVERLVMLRIIDSLWVEHLTAMEHMREGIGLYAVAQRDPLVAYKTEGHNSFRTCCRLFSMMWFTPSTMWALSKKKPPPLHP